MALMLSLLRPGAVRVVLDTGESSVAGEADRRLAPVIGRLVPYRVRQAFSNDERVYCEGLM